MKKIFPHLSRIGLSGQDVARIIDSLFELIKQDLEKGKDVLISGFGKFCVREKHERRGRNPQTGEQLTLPSRKVVTFKWSTKLKDELNKTAEDRRKDPWGKRR